MDSLQEYNSFDYENFAYLEEPPKSPNNLLGTVDKIDFDDFSVEYYTYNISKLSYLTNYIYPFWRQQFISNNLKDTEEKDSFNPYSTWSNSDLARHNMGLKDNTLCFQMVMCDVPIGFCSLLLLDNFDRTDRFSPFSNEIYKDALVFYNFVIEKGFRGQGYGRKLLDIVLSYISKNLNTYRGVPEVAMLTLASNAGSIVSEVSSANFGTIGYKYIVLYVDKDNQNARTLYEKSGFTLIGDNPSDTEQVLYSRLTI
jgi:ribosomal protein S18 acetylase RimI-like enzyme